MDAKMIKKSILGLYKQWNFGGEGVEPNDRFIQQFERHALTRQLAEIFDEHVSKL